MLKRICVTLLIVLVISTVKTFAQSTATKRRIELLWPSGAPDAIGTEDVDRPTLEFFMPPEGKANGTAVIVCPGGGYVKHAMDHEGKQIAEWFNSHGVTAFVLKYRLGQRYRHPAPLQDAQRAIRYVRHHAKDMNVAADRIGIMGFSAGGHLAATTGTHIDMGNAQAVDHLDRLSARPDFLILAYPVISFTAEYTHQGSSKSLLGSKPDPQLLENLSNEKQVTPQTPPTFLFHTNEDTGVPPENSVSFYLALRKAKVPAELHIYERGKHGVGFAPTDPILSTWSGRLADWLKTRGLISAGE